MAKKYIKEQLDSILIQLNNDDEVIISDDSSTDTTLEIIESLHEPRIHLYKNQKFRSPIFNFENALRYSSGDYIFLSDQDDIWMPDKVQTMLKYLESGDLILSDCQIIDECGKLLFPSFFEKNGSRSGLVNNLFKNSYIGCCMAFNRKILAKALPFPSDIPMHDWWIGLIGEIYGKSIFYEEKLIAYRRHETNLSASAEISQYSLLQKVHFRIIMLKNILKRYFFYA